MLACWALLNLLKPPNSHIVNNEFLVNCIDSIFDSNYQNFEVILVDNASSDQTYQICKEKHPKINLIINEKNLGYCGGNNIGINSAKGEFIIILNPDTVVDPNWITEFLKSYKLILRMLKPFCLFILYKSNKCVIGVKYNPVIAPLIKSFLTSIFLFKSNVILFVIIL